MKKFWLNASASLALVLLAASFAAATDYSRGMFVLTSTNDASKNQVVIFKLNHGSTPSLSLVKSIPTGGAGGASGNAGAVQFGDFSGAVVNYNSNNVSQLVRYGDFIGVARVLPLTGNCERPVSVALSRSQMFVVGANCAESHSWPGGYSDGRAVPISDSSAAQIVAGQSWAAVTLKSGSVLQLPLDHYGALTGSDNTITLPTDANDTPLGAAFWGDILGIDPAHSPDSFALVNSDREVFAVEGPQPAYPTNAPCWLAKGPGNVWYAGNSPGHAISIFFSDDRGGSFYKSMPLPGVPTDITVSHDQKWLAVIYTAADGSGARIAVFSIDAYGGLSLAATSNPVGVSAFSGVAFSQ